MTGPSTDAERDAARQAWVATGRSLLDPSAKVFLDGWLARASAPPREDVGAGNPERMKAWERGDHHGIVCAADLVEKILAGRHVVDPAHPFSDPAMARIEKMLVQRLSAPPTPPREEPGAKDSVYWRTRGDLYAAILAALESHEIGLADYCTSIREGDGLHKIVLRDIADKACDLALAKAPQPTAAPPPPPVAPTREAKCPTCGSGAMAVRLCGYGAGDLDAHPVGDPALGVDGKDCFLCPDPWHTAAAKGGEAASDA